MSNFFIGVAVGFLLASIYVSITFKVPEIKRSVDTYEIDDFEACRIKNSYDFCIANFSSLDD